MENKETLIVKLDKFDMVKRKDGSGQFPKFITSQGEFSCFEESVANQIYAHQGKYINIEIATRPNGYKNLIGFVGLVDEEVAKKMEEMQPETPTPQQNVPQSQPAQSVVNEIKNIQIREAPNSWEFGKADNRVKIYFEDATDLKAKAEAVLKERISLNLLAKALEETEDEKAKVKHLSDELAKQGIKPEDAEKLAENEIREISKTVKG